MLNIKEHVFIERWLQRDWIVEFLGDTTSGSLFDYQREEEELDCYLFVCVIIKGEKIWDNSNRFLRRRLRLMSRKRFRRRSQSSLFFGSSPIVLKDSE